MPLDFQNVEIDLGQGLDQKSDSKQVIATKMTILKNRVFTKLKQLKKVFSFNRLSNFDIDGVEISNATATGTYQDELLLLNDSNVYSYSDAATSWIDKGQISPVWPKSKIAVQNDYSQRAIDCALCGDYIVFAYLDSRGGVRAHVMDRTLESDILIDTSISSTATFVRVIALDTNVVGVLYVEGSTLKVQRFQSTNPTGFAAAQTLKTDVNASYPFMDASVRFTDGVVAYFDDGDDITVFTVSNAGLVTATAVISLAGLLDQDVRSISLTYDSVGQNTYVAFYEASQSKLHAFVRDTSLNSVLAITELDSVSSQFKPNPVVTGYISATNTIKYVYEYIYVTNGEGSQLRTVTLTTGGTVGTPTFLHRGVSIASKAFKRSSEGYVNVVHISDAQSTYFTIRLNDGFVVSKMLPGRAGTWAYGTGAVSSVGVDGDLFYFGAQIKNKLVNVSADVVYSLYGVCMMTLEFEPTETTFQTVELEQGMAITGGVTRWYDGASTTELGFNLYPLEVFDSMSGSTTGLFEVTVVQAGSAGTKEIFTAQMITADLIATGQYFNFSNAADANLYYIWFVKDGAGADPAPVGRTARMVEITSNMSASEVADAVLDCVFNTPLVGITVTKDSPSKLRFSNTSNGATTNAANVNVGEGSLSNGTYLYRATYEWRDAAGNIHRSAPSPVLEQTVSGTTFTKVSAPYLSLTDKEGVQIVFYRTVNNGSIFYRASSVLTPNYNRTDDVTTNCVFTDVFSDTEIQTREVLYTTGGVVDHIGPPSSTFLLNGKERLFLYSEEEGSFFYSKQLVSGEGPGFNEALSFSGGALRKKITAATEMDDKIIFFEEDTPYVIVGEGPTDVGSDNSFSSPELIQSTVGCIDPLSIVKLPMGVIRKTKKGFYLLGRDLQDVYIGAPVEDFNDDRCLGAVLLPEQSQARFLLDSGKFLIYDYEMNQWSERTSPNLVGATDVGMTLWGGQTAILQSIGAYYLEEYGQFTRGDESADIVTQLETGWLHVAGLQGFQRVTRLSILGDYKSAHTLTVAVGYDYDTSYAIADTYTITPTSTNPLNVEIHLRRQKCTALRVKITDGAVGGTLLEGNTLTQLTLRVGVKRGTNKLAAARRS